MNEQLIETAIKRALDDLLGDLPAKPVTREKLEHVLRTTAQRVATDAANAARLELLTTEAVAERLGVSPRRVRVACQPLVKT